VTVHEVAKDGTTSYHWTMKSSASGLHLVDDKFMDWNPPLWRLKLPFRNGDTWAVGVVAKPKNERVTFDETWKFAAYGPEEVRVPAGTFKAIRVEREAQLLRSQDTMWYAPGVGMVKHEFGFGPRVRPERGTAVLTAFTPGKP
jgi:hypothetical protein